MVIAAALTGIGVAIAAIFVGLLYMSDNPRLPSLNRIQRDRHAIKRGSYDVADLTAPLVTPDSHCVFSHSSYDRASSDVSSVSTSDTTEPLEFVAFSRKNTDAKQHFRNSFRHSTIRDYTSRYASGKLSPVQVPSRVFVERRDDEILAQAQASAEPYAQGKPLGVLDGVPIVVKDDMDVQGFKFLGAIIVGKTNMHNIGSGVRGFNMTYGTPRNPYHPGHYTGGSSTDSAVAVAAGIVPFAIGLGASGSIRIPAGLCGVVGLKATFLRVPPICNDCPSLGHLGPIAGSVRDAALAYAIMNDGHESVAWTLRRPDISLDDFDETASLHALRIGCFPAYINHATPEIASSTLAPRSAWSGDRRSRAGLSTGHPFRP